MTIRYRCFLVFVTVLLIAAYAAPSYGEDALAESLKSERKVPKKMQHEISLNGGAFLGDQSHSSWAVGGNYHFMINPTWAVGAAYTYAPIVTDRSSTFGQSLRSSQQHFINGEVMISNDAAFRAGKSIIECDFYLTLGAGVLWINEKYEPLGVIGGGLRVYTPLRWMAVRVDVNSYMHYTPIPTGDVFSADLTMIGGISFIFPVRKDAPFEETIQPEEPQGVNSGNVSTQETLASSSSGTTTLTEASTAELE